MKKLSPSRSSHRPSNHASVGQVRIIGGDWRRQKIEVLAHEGLRPSSDRVRETVFNWMMHQWGGVFEGKSIFDAFAGSGAFGLECISRGARDVTLVDTHRPAVSAMRSTLARWGVAADVREMDVLLVCREFAASGKRFDWIVLDPPFGNGWLERVVPAMTALAHEQTWLYVEVEAGGDLSSLAAHGWESVREGKTKQVQYGLFRQKKLAPLNAEASS